MQSIELSLFADYFQFYVQDEVAAGDLFQSWDDEATSRLLAVAPGTIGIGTVRNMEDGRGNWAQHETHVKEDSTAWWKDVPRGTTGEVSSYVRLDLSLVVR